MAGNKTYEELQEALFGGLVEILRVCQEEKIRFFLGGETLLGAYLKEDFLPWSYKAVLLMPREDYEVFRILLSTGLEALCPPGPHDGWALSGGLPPHEGALHPGGDPL